MWIWKIRNLTKFPKFQVFVICAVVSQISCGILAPAPYYYQAAPAVIHKTIEIQTTAAPPSPAEPVEYEFKYGESILD